MPTNLEAPSVTGNDYADRLRRRVEAYRARWPQKYAEHECYAWMALNPPLRYRSGDLHGFIALVLQEMTIESIRESQKWPKETEWLASR